MAVRIFPPTTATRPAGPVVVREPFHRGLVAAFAPGLGGGLIDLVAGVPLATASGAVLSVGGGTAGLLCAALGARAETVCPASLKFTTEVSIVARVAFTGTPTINSNIFGVLANDTDTAPYVSYGLSVNGAGMLRAHYSSSGSFTEISSSGLYPSPAALAGTPVTVAAVFTAGGVTVYLGPDDGFFLVTAFAPTYTATSLLIMGERNATRNPAQCLEYGLIYNRRLTPNELAVFRANPYHWVQVGSPRWTVGDVAPVAVARAEPFVWLPV